MSINPKLFLLLVMISLLNLVSCRKDEVSNQIYDVILVMGQSNNYYGSGLADLSPMPSSNNIMQLGRYDENNYKIIMATESLHHHTQEENKGGYAFTFAHLYEAEVLKKNHKILLIPCAEWGTAFSKESWNKGDKNYLDALERTVYTLSQFPKSKLSAILWHQGESDINNENYQTDLDTFITNFRKKLNATKTPLILGGMVPFWVKQNQNRMNIQNTIEFTPNRIKNTAYANPEIPFLIEKNDNSVDSVHYNASGLRELGKRYFESFLSIYNE